MKKVNRIIYGFIAVYLVGHFIVSIRNHYILISSRDYIELSGLDGDYILRNIITGHFLEVPFLLLGLIGLIYKKFTGWIFLLLYPVLFVIYRLYFSFNWEGFGQQFWDLVFPIIIILLINTPGLKKIYKIDDLKFTLWGNSVAIMTGLAVCTWIAVHYEIWKV